MVRGEPTFLSDIMDTIAQLKEARGSLPSRILDHLEAQNKAPLRNGELQVKKALKNGIKTGLIKEVSGKFKLGLAPRDYAILRSFRLAEKGLNLPIRELRRRKGRRSRSRRRRGRRRRRSDYYSLGMGDEDSTDDYSIYKNYKNITKSSSLPVKELRRRGKRRSRSRRRRGRRRRRNDYYDSENLAIGTDESGSEPMDRGRRRKGRSRRRKGRRRRGRRRGFGPEDDVDSVRSIESKEASEKSSDEKPKTAKPQGRGDTVIVKSEPEKREIVPVDPPRSRIDPTEHIRSAHCIHDHSYHHDGPYSYHPPPHYGEQYYD